MKNFKKVLSLVLAFAMVLSTMTIAFAATNDDKAEVLYKLGLFKGVSTTEFDAALDQETDAAQAIALIGRALQWETDEDATVAFTDVPDWAVPYIAYAVDAEITNGVSDTTFGTEYIDGQRMVAWTLRALGYDMTEAWDKTDELAEEAGLTVPEGKLRDDVVAVIYEALTTTPVDGDQTLIEMIVGDDAQLRAVAEAEGLIQPVPEEVEVVSIESLNLVQLEVVFNQAVTEKTAEKLANYKVKDGTNTITITSADLQDDMKTVVLTLNTAIDKNLAQQAKVDVTVDKVENEAGLVLEKTTVEDVQALDMTIPTVEKMEIVGKRTIKVTFSEPVEPTTNATATAAARLDKDGFKVNDGKLYVNKAELQNNNTEALVMLYSDLKEGDITVEVNNKVADYAGFGIVKTTEDLTVVKDTEAPVIVGFEKATPSSVVVVWNEDITIEKSAVDNYYHTNSANKIANPLTSADIDGNKMTLKFTNELPSGSKAITAYVYVLKEAVADLWGNKNAQQMVAVEVESDVTAPTVVGDIIIDAEDQFTVEFSEDLDAKSAEDEDNYKVLDSDSKEVKNLIRNAVYTASNATDNAKVVFTLSKKISGVHALVIEDVEDLSDNTIADTTISFDVDDLTDPKFTDFTATAYYPGQDGKQLIKVNFGEKMATDGKYSVADLDKYTFAGKVLSNVKADITIDVVDDGKAIEINIPTKAEDTDSFNIPTGSTPGTLTIARVADAADNFTVAVSGDVVVKEAGKVAIKSVEATATDKIKVVFEGKFDNFDSTDLTFRNVTTTTTVLTTGAVDTDVNSDGNFVATYTLADSSKLKYNAQFGTEKVEAFVADTDSVNSYGETLDASATKEVADKIAPALEEKAFAPSTDKVDDVTVVDNVISLNFEENIDLASVSTTTFEVDDATVEAVRLKTGDSSVVELVLKAGDKAVERTNVTQKAPLKDAAGNTVSDISTEVATYTNVNLSPVLSSATASGFVLTYSQDLYDKTSGTPVAIVDGADIKGLFTAAGGTLSISSATYNKSAHTVTFVLANAADTNNITATANLVSPYNYATDSLKDVATYDSSATPVWALN